MKNILRLTGLVLTVFLLVLVSSLSAEAVELNPSLKINVYCLHNQESTIKNVKTAVCFILHSHPEWQDFLFQLLPDLILKHAVLLC